MLRFNYGKALAYSSFIRGIYFSKNMGGSKKQQLQAGTRQAVQGTQRKRRTRRRRTKKSRDYGDGKF